MERVVEVRIERLVEIPIEVPIKVEFADEGEVKTKIETVYVDRIV